MTSIRYPTLTEIDAAKSPRGGYSKAQLAGWGVAWPPKSGWKYVLHARAKHQRWVEKYGNDEQAEFLRRDIERAEAFSLERSP